MKRFLKGIVVAILARQVRSLRKEHHFKTIGVVGGIGKTSTKLAIAESLSKSLRVRYQDGNYNDIVSVPLIFFGQPMPSLFNPFAWIKIFIDNARQIKGDYPFDVVVVEVGTNGPGDIAAFEKYLKLDYTIVTAIVPEHMEYFGDMQAVSNEELSVAAYSDRLIYNAAFVPEAYRQPLHGAISYGTEKPADYQLVNISRLSGGFECDIRHDGKVLLHFSHEAASEIQLYYVLAAVVIGNELRLTPAQIHDGITAIKPVSGRLRRLHGINDSLIIDDTYNASPDTVKAGLQVLYSVEAPQRIAILGNMNELGGLSDSAHKEIGEFCDPTKLALVVTIGPDANNHLASAAEAKGCSVKRFDNPYAAGEYLQDKIERGAVIFAKGSQGMVFAEEAIKLLLADSNDAAKLVRQSNSWLKFKQKSFKSIIS